MTAQLCDVNVWLALALSGHAHHSAARQMVLTTEHLLGRHRRHATA